MRRTALLLCALSLVSCSRLAHTRTFTVPSGSMEPSLRRGDRISCSTRVPGALRRGQVAVFRGTDAVTEAQTYVKRVVGVGGDTVEGKPDGTVYVNGAPVVEVYADKEGSMTFEPVTVPAGTYFVLGDNRDGSSDSRFNGPLPHGNVVATCTRIVSPRSHRGRIPGTP